MEELYTLKKSYLDECKKNEKCSEICSEKIYINDNNYRQIEPGAFQNFRHLHSLTISKCDLKKIESITFKIYESKSESLSCLESLNLCNNQLTNLVGNTFKHTPKLAKIYLSNNLIKTISHSAFHHLHCLRELILNNNKLVSIEADLFKNLDNLMLVDLSFNFIQIVRDGTFHNLRNLSGIDLSYNRLNEIEKEAFVYLPRLEKLNLGNNFLTKIKPQTFQNLTNHTIQMKINLACNSIVYENNSMCLFTFLNPNSKVKFADLEFSITELQTGNINFNRKITKVNKVEHFTPIHTTESCLDLMEANRNNKIASLVVSNQTKCPPLAVNLSNRSSEKKSVRNLIPMSKQHIDWSNPKTKTFLKEYSQDYESNNENSTTKVSNFNADDDPDLYVSFANRRLFISRSEFQAIKNEIQNTGDCASLRVNLGLKQTRESALEALINNEFDSDFVIKLLKELEGDKAMIELRHDETFKKIIKNFNTSAHIWMLRRVFNYLRVDEDRAIDYFKYCLQSERENIALTFYEHCLCMPWNRAIKHYPLMMYFSEMCHKRWWLLIQFILDDFKIKDCKRDKSCRSSDHCIDLTSLDYLNNDFSRLLIKHKLHSNNTCLVKNERVLDQILFFERNPLASIFSSGEDSLLEHEVVQKYTHLKWRLLPRTAYYFHLTWLLLLLVFYTLGVTDFSNSTQAYIILSIIILCFLLLHKIFHTISLLFRKQRLFHFSSHSHLYEYITYGLAISTCGIILDSNSHYNLNMTSSLYAVTLVLLYILFILRLDKVPLIGFYASAIRIVAIRSLKLTPFIVILFVGFVNAFRLRSISSYIQPDNRSPPNMVSYFQNSSVVMSYYLLKMMLGNVELNQMGMTDWRYLDINAVNYILVFAFVLFLTICAYNMLIGIAVNEISRTICRANLQILESKMSYVLMFDYEVLKPLTDINYSLYGESMLYRWEKSNHLCLEYHPRHYHFSFVLLLFDLLAWSKKMLLNPIDKQRICENEGLTKLKKSNKLSELDQELDRVKNEIYNLKKSTYRMDKILNEKLDRLLNSVQVSIDK